MKVGIPMKSLKPLTAIILVMLLILQLSVAFAEYTDSETILAVQQALADAGVYKGNISGIKGNATEAAIRTYQQKNGLKVTGQIDDDLLEMLGLLSGEITLVSNIMLSEESILLGKNGSITLKVSIEPKKASNKRVDWYSTNEQVAVVKDGVVTAISNGTCNIICRAQDESGVEIICPVLVVEKVPRGEKGTCGDEAIWVLDSQNTLIILGLGKMDNYENNYKAPYPSNRIRNVVIYDGITTIGSQSFWFCNNLTSVTIPETVTEIGYSCFTGCEKLSKIVIPDSVTTIGTNIFSGCTKLSDVTLSNNLKEIPNKCFYMCNALTTVVLPEGLKTIGWSAFGQCKSLESIIIPDGVTKIGDYAFADCKNLVNVTIPSSVKTISNDAFANSPKVTLNVYENSYAHQFAIKKNIAFTIIGN